MLITFSGIVMVSKDSQSPNAPLLIYFNPDGRRTSSSDTQLQKHPIGIVSILFERVIDFRL